MENQDKLNFNHYKTLFKCSVLSYLQGVSVSVSECMQSVRAVLLSKFTQSLMTKTEVRHHSVFLFSLPQRLGEAEQEYGKLPENLIPDTEVVPASIYVCRQLILLL